MRTALKDETMNPEVPIDQPPHPSITENLSALTRLLCGLFATYREFCRFLYLLPNHRQIEYELPSYDSSASLAELIFTAVVALARRGMIDQGFFAALVEAFPSRFRQIRDIAHVMGFMLVEPPVPNNLFDHGAWDRPRWLTRAQMKVVLGFLGLTTAVSLTWQNVTRHDLSPTEIKATTDKLDHRYFRAELRRLCRELAKPGDVVVLNYAYDTLGNTDSVMDSYNHGNPRLGTCTAHLLSHWQRQWNLGRSGETFFEIPFP